MALAKLTIKPLGAANTAGSSSGEEIVAMFNPKEYTITKSTPWKHHDVSGYDSPTLEFSCL